MTLGDAIDLEFELGLLTLVDGKLNGVEIENPLLPVPDNLAMPPTVFPAHRAFPTAGFAMITCGRWG